MESKFNAEEASSEILSTEVSTGRVDIDSEKGDTPPPECLSENLTSHPIPEPDSNQLPKRKGGPRTQLGKQRSRRNAITHGFYSCERLLKGKSRREFHQLWSAYWEQFCPEGPQEEALIEIAVTALWSYRKVELAQIQACEDGVLLGRMSKINRTVTLHVVYPKPPAPRGSVQSAEADKTSSQEKIESTYQIPANQPGFEVIPEDRRAILLMRAGAHYLRVHERSIDQLERRQRIRKGQPIPPEINVRLTKDQ